MSAAAMTGRETLPERRERLEHYLRLLRKWQKSINLVSPNTLDNAWQRHVEDSLQLADLIPPGAIIFDLGSGAGFPGLVLAMVRPDLDVTLIESDTKKCTFLSTVSRETKTPVKIENQRIESVSRETIPAIVIARALASLDKLCGYCLPWAQANPDLMILLLKGRKAREEIAQARQNYSFDVQVISSRTDAEGCIVQLSNLATDSGG